MRPFPRPFPLADSDWRRLSAIGGLPDNAQAEVESILGWGRHIADVDATSQPAHATRARLSVLHRKAQALLEDLGVALAQSEVLIALTDLPESESTSFGHPTRRTMLTELNRRIEALARLAEWLQNAGERVPGDKRASKNAAPDFLTSDVDALLRRHKRSRLTSGERKSDPSREFLDECLALVGMKVGADSIIRKLAKRRSKVSAERI
jgi:hypothetical protein